MLMTTPGMPHDELAAITPIQRSENETNPGSQWFLYHAQAQRGQDINDLFASVPGPNLNPCCAISDFFATLTGVTTAWGTEGI